MNIKKIINCIEIAELIVIVLYLLSFFLIAPSWHNTLPSYILVGGMALTIGYGIFAMITFVSFSANLFSRFEGNVQPQLIIFAVGLLLSNIAITGIMFLCKYYPGATMMVIVGTLGLTIVVIYFAFQLPSKGQKTPPLAIKLPGSSSLLSFTNKEIFLRFATLFVLSIATFYCVKVMPSIGSNSLFRCVFMEVNYCDKYSTKEMDIASAWYYIDRGYDCEKVLKQYALTESEYDQKVNQVVFGRDAQPFQKRQVTLNDSIVNKALRSADSFSCPPFPIDPSSFVQPDDTAYINSQIPVFVKDYAPVFREYYYLEIIDRNTTDPKFKQFMSQLTKWKEYMDDGGVFF